MPASKIRPSPFLTNGSPLAPCVTAIRTDFYREEFLKHRQRLEEQREYYSERAISQVEDALAKILSELDHLSAKADADQVVSQLLKKFDRVTGLSAWSDPKNLH